tara:strand:- start:954 stop:1130 length:177 start_codon:yes stop_codon:yes gene_type:complete
MYKIKLKKDIEFRGVEYIKGETYEVGRKERNHFANEDAIAKPTKKKSKEDETPKDLDN